MPSATKAVIFNVGCFLADNNIRRNIATLSLNYTSATAGQVNSYLTINPGETQTWTTPSSLNPSAVTLINTTGNLDCSFTFNDGTLSYELVVQKMHLVDRSVSQVVITNPSVSQIVQVLIIQA
jgi:hypothetical protein